MDRVYVVRYNEYDGDVFVLGVARTVEKAKEIAQDNTFEGPLAWEGDEAHTTASTWFTIEQFLVE